MAGIVDKIKAKLPGHKHDPVVDNAANTPGYNTTTGTTGMHTTGTTATGTTHQEPMGERIKEKLGMGHHTHGTAAGMGGAGMGTTMGTTMGRKDSSSSSSSSEGGSPRAAGVLGAQTYTTVEEAAVVKEHVQVIREHHPVQHNYVVETKEVGVRELPPKVESLGVTERVIEETPIKGHTHVAPIAAAGLATTTTTTHQHGGLSGGNQTGTGGGMFSSSDTRHDTRTTAELK